MKKSNHTRKVFKDKIKDMTIKQREEYLTELHQNLMTERTRAQQGLEIKNIRELRKQIAILKTILHHPGYHYKPRAGVE
jgi:ribosomal protein L29